MSVDLRRLAALTAVALSLELLERIAYRAGVTDAAAAADQTLAGLAEDPRDGDDDLEDDPEPFDGTDVLAFHGYVTR